MSKASLRCSREEGGQASVELIGAIPALLLAVLVAAQVIAAGHALWSAGLAARAGARAAVVGGDPVVAARRALPPVLRDGSRVAAPDPGTSDPVSVRVEVPHLLPGLPVLRVGSRTGLGGGGG